MDCARLKEQLVPYHFGTLPDAEADAVDAHLLACTACLRVYLALKRAAKPGDRATAERPSEEVRARLRRNVEAHLASRRAASSSPAPRFLLRRIPLYQGVMAAALAAGVALVLPAALRAPRAASSIDPSSNAPEIDTSRQDAKSFRIY